MADRITRCRPLLGTFVEVTSDSGAAIDAAFEAIARAHALMSAHEPESDVSRVNRFGHLDAIEIDDWTVQVLRRALFWSEGSGGAFDAVAAGAAAIRQGYLPRHPGQPRPQAADWTSLEIFGRTARLLKPGCIDLGGIAKGYAVDQAIAAIKSAGASAGLVNAGGDIAGFGPHPWPVQVVQPQTRRAIANVVVSNGAIATSSIQPDGSDTHLFDRSVALLSATVCAPAGIDADALTKVVVSGSPLAPACLKRAEAQAFVVESNGTISPVDLELQAA